MNGQFTDLMSDIGQKARAAAAELAYAGSERKSAALISAAEAIWRRRGIEARRFLMVGNSLKSDIVPVLALGGAGVHVPYHLTWAAEQVEKGPEAGADFFQIEILRELPAVVRTWAAGRTS